MRLQIAEDLLAEIQAHGQDAYPEEGAGFLLGRDDGQTRRVLALLPVDNEREDSARHNRYLIGPEQMLRAELEADARELDLIGVFHSHPDHPNQPSETDREWAMPWFSYLITTVAEGAAAGSRSWRLNEDRAAFAEEELELISPELIKE